MDINFRRMLNDKYELPIGNTSKNSVHNIVNHIKCTIDTHFYNRDFSYFTMKSINSVRFVGGFAMAGSVTPEQYAAATPDPIAPFAAPIMK